MYLLFRQPQQPGRLLMITSVYQPYLKAYKIKFPDILAQIVVSTFFFHLACFPPQIPIYRHKYSILPPTRKDTDAKSPCGPSARRGLGYALAFLTPAYSNYSISIRLGFAGRALVCCGAGSWICRMPSSNFAWMSSFFTASPT